MTPESLEEIEAKWKNYDYLSDDKIIGELITEVRRLRAALEYCAKHGSPTAQKALEGE